MPKPKRLAPPGVDVFDSGHATPYGWVQIQRVDEDDIYGDDFEAACAVLKAIGWESSTKQPGDAPIAYYAPSIGALLETCGPGFEEDSAGKQSVFDLLDALPIVRESCPSWIILIPLEAARKAGLV